MGAWGVLAFDNDSANDWAYGLEKVSDLSLVESAIATALYDQDFLDGDEGSDALAACEVIARLRGSFGYQNAYTKKVDNWVRAHPIVPPPKLIAQALQAIDRVLSPTSELRELWEQGDDTAWRDSVLDLRRRVEG